MDITSQEIEFIKITDLDDDKSTIHKGTTLSVIKSFIDNYYERDIQVVNTKEHKQFIRDSFLKNENKEERANLALLSLVLSYFDELETIFIIDRFTALRNSEVIEYIESYYSVIIRVATEDEYTQFNEENRTKIEENEKLVIEDSLNSDDLDDFDFVSMDDSPTRTCGKQVIRKENPTKKQEIDFGKLKFVLSVITALAIFTIYFVSH